jgi:hypothetical protein
MTNTERKNNFWTSLGITLMLFIGLPCIAYFSFILWASNQGNTPQVQNSSVVVSQRIATDPAVYSPQVEPQTSRPDAVGNGGYLFQSTTPKGDLYAFSNQKDLTFFEKRHRVPVTDSFVWCRRTEPGCHTFSRF